MEYHSRLLFSSFQCHFKGSPEDGARPGNGSGSTSKMANPGMVFNSNENVDQPSSSITAQSKTINATQPSPESSSTTQEAGFTCLLLVRRQLQTSALSQTAADIIMCAWRAGTKKQYHTYLKKWENYCNSQGIDPVSASVAQAINFLAELVCTGVGYSAINTARSAISTILEVNNSTFGMHPMAKRFLKGVFEQKPSLPRYDVIWDVNQVLNKKSVKLRCYPPIESISLKDDVKSVLRVCVHSFLWAHRKEC